MDQLEVLRKLKLIDMKIKRVFEDLPSYSCNEIENIVNESIHWIDKSAVAIGTDIDLCSSHVETNELLKQRNLILKATGHLIKLYNQMIE